VSELSRRVAVVGVGSSRFGNFPESDANGLAAEALRNALDDAGLRANEIDGLVVNRVPHYARFGEMTGISPRWGAQFPAEGRMSGISIEAAVMAIACGMASTVALVYGNNGRSRRVYYGGDPSFWAPWGMTSPGAQHALLWRKHMLRYGSTTEQLGQIAVTFREHALLNPNAVMKRPISLEDHRNARYIAEPLGLFDYCLINDGGVALILTSAERARDLRKPPVYIAGMARADDYRAASTCPDDFWFGAMQQCAERVYAMAGLGREAVDVLQIYDNFTPTVVFSLEGFGFCAQGEGGRFVENGRLRLSGALPANTSGGHLSESYMQGWGLNVEAVRQVRGECGPRQVAGCNVAQFLCATPCSVSIIYTR